MNGQEPPSVSSHFSTHLFFTMPLVSKPVCSRFFVFWMQEKVFLRLSVYPWALLPSALPHPIPLFSLLRTSVLCLISFPASLGLLWCLWALFNPRDDRCLSFCCNHFQSHPCTPEWSAFCLRAQFYLVTGTQRCLLLPHISPGVFQREQ